eukprot:3739785-Pyramimonas_sp.AAC.1
MAVAISISQILHVTAAMVAGTAAYVVAVQIPRLGSTIGHSVSRAPMKRAATCPITQRLLASTPRRNHFQTA